MAEENVSILRVDTGEAVKSVNDLKENIKLLKGNLGELTIGTEEYQSTLEELTINQNALKNAMHATSASLEEVVAAAASANVEFDEQNKLINQSNVSYNELVNTMAALKEEWRSTTDEAKRSELAEKIADINSRLKGMDASVGNFSRNVGNYESGVAGLVAKFDTWGETLKNIPPTLGPVKDNLGKVGETMQLIGKQPILGIVGLLAPIIMKIAEALKENETAMGAVQKIMTSLQPIFDFVNIILEKIAQGFAKVVEKVIGFVVAAEPIKKVVSIITGVGNSILQYLLTPIRAAVEGFKGLGNIMKDVFTGKFGDIKKHAKEAGQGIADAWKEGLSFKANFEVGQEMGANLVEGIKSSSNKETAKTAGEEIGKEVGKGIEEETNKFVFDENTIKKAEEAEDKRLQARKKAQEEEDAFEAELYAEDEAEMEAFFAEQAQYEENARIATENAEAKKREAREKTLATMDAAASATSGILSSLADMMESDEKNAEKNEKKIKALRIASATIDMLQGAVGAFSQASSTLPPPFGQIVGAASAAAVVAMGIANINKMKSTNPSSGGGGATPSVSTSTPASVNAPNIETQLTSVRNVTSASEEDRLNKMASSQKVYILQSDIEASGERSKVQVAESSF